MEILRYVLQGWLRLETYLNMEGFLENSQKMNVVLDEA